MINKINQPRNYEIKLKKQQNNIKQKSSKTVGNKISITVNALHIDSGEPIPSEQCHKKFNANGRSAVALRQLLQNFVKKK